MAQLQLDLLAGWRDAGGFSARERAALGLTEAATRLPAEGVTDEVWRAVSGQFTDEEAASLLWLIGVINDYNRVNVAARMPPRSRPPG